jgi:integration host factor subunit beta
VDRPQLITTLLARYPDSTRAEIKAIVIALFKKMVNQLAQGKRVEIRKFGAFERRLHPGRKRHNPRTGEEFYALPRYAVNFRPGEKLQAAAQKAKPQLSRVARRRMGKKKLCPQLWPATNLAVSPGRIEDQDSARHG